jgi:hypothetical protein
VLPCALYLWWRGSTIIQKLFNRLDQDQDTTTDIGCVEFATLDHAFNGAPTDAAELAAGLLERPKQGFIAH